MKITNIQADYLREVLNVGIGRAAKQLSLLLDDEVTMTIPELKIAQMEFLSKYYQADSGDELACVYQNVSGCMNGRTLIIFNGQNQSLLIDTILNTLSVSDLKLVGIDYQDSLVEVGNVIMSSCISALADMLAQEVTLSIPTYVEMTFEKLIENTRQFQIEHLESQEKVMIISTELSASSQRIKGSLLFIISEQSLVNILENVNDLEM